MAEARCTGTAEFPPTEHASGASGLLAPLDAVRRTWVSVRVCVLAAISDRLVSDPERRLAFDSVQDRMSSVSLMFLKY